MISLRPANSADIGFIKTFDLVQASTRADSDAQRFWRTMGYID
tara:strand:+ start:758 stop:886 length:129 start_codon:yes stop_codon:yes gene_type:complete